MIEGNTELASFTIKEKSALIVGMIKEIASRRGIELSLRKKLKGASK